MLKIEARNATLKHINIRAQNVGPEDKVAMMDIKLTTSLAHDEIDMIARDLSKALFIQPDEPGAQGDFTDGRSVRFPDAKPWSTTAEWPGYSVGMQTGAVSGEEVELEHCDLKKITCQPHEGGIAEVTFTVSAEADADVLKAIIWRLEQEVVVTLTPPAAID